MYYVHVNQHKIRKNIHADESEIEPPIAIRRGRTGPVSYALRVRLPESCSIIYSPRSPLLSCGARLVIECPEEPEILE